MFEDNCLKSIDCYELNNEQKNLLSKFIDENLKNLDELFLWHDDDREIIAKKFLIARKWNYNDAVKMLNETNKWRKENGIKNWPLFPSAIPIPGFCPDAINQMFKLSPRNKGTLEDLYRHIHVSYHCNFHKWDNTGHPIIIELTGRTNVKNLLKTLKAISRPGSIIAQPILDLHLHQNEISVYLSKFMDKTRSLNDSRRITSMTAILDLKGLSYSHLNKEGIDIIRYISSIDEKYYPEGLYRVFAVNCPSLVMIAFNIAKTFLDKRTQDKFIFVSPEKTAETLLKYINEENLPSFLGGKCCCKNGCVYGVNGEGVFASSSSEQENENDELTSEIIIGSGTVFKKTFNVDINHKIIWDFEIKNEKSINFWVSFLPQNNSNKQEIVISSTKCSKHNGSFISKETGVLTILWDNKDSWITSKSLRYRIAHLNENDTIICS